MKEKRIIIQIVLKNDDYILNNYSSLIENLYTFLLPPLKLKNTKKILIKLINQPSCLEIMGEKTGQELYLIRNEFDFAFFESVNSDQKKDYLCDAAFECLKALFAVLRLDLEILVNTYKHIKKIDYQLKNILCGGPKKNNNKTIVGQVIAEHFLDYALLNVNFKFLKTSETKTVILFKTYPTFFFYSKLIWTAKWTSNTTFLVSNKLKEINLEININGDISIVDTPINREIEWIKDEIRYLTLEICFPL
ncbi:hypothetical protein [Mucilaginibacter xinganensis]|uniref:Uncharacterized protein n=1 Tax=Mucilaginibacter xinganensis TaxID=1234841 RepID=A0A223P2G5_9SPHI|nr:hypothetical protein [Mucilaginibacter xinganensis]ASU36339.1 hypothetical protein MuYL_4454 [Mucilaginibacter xinganensis]